MGMLHPSGAADHAEIQLVAIAPDGDIQAVALLQGSHRVQGFQHRLLGFQGFPGTRYVGHRDLARILIALGVRQFEAVAWKQNKVFRLDIAVNDPVFVRAGEARYRLARQVECAVGAAARGGNGGRRGWPGTSRGASAPRLRPPRSTGGYRLR